MRLSDSKLPHAALPLGLVAAALAAAGAARADDSHPSPRRAPLLQRMGAVPQSAPFSPVLPDALPRFAPEAIGFRPSNLQPCFIGEPTAADIAAWDRMMNPFGLRYFHAGGRWGPSIPNTPFNFMWSLVPDGTIIPGDEAVPTGPSNLFAKFDEQFGGPHNRHRWISHFEWAFRRWGEFTGVTYTRVKFNGNDWDDGAPFGAGGQLGSPGLAGVRGDTRIAGKHFVPNSPIAAGNTWPNLGGDMVFNFNVNFANDLVWFRNVICHEHGHGLGLAHVCSSIPSLMGAAPGVNTSAVRGPQHDDIRAAMMHYGDAFEPNNSAATASNLSSLPVGRILAPGEESHPVIPFSSRLSLIDGDEDFFKFSVPVASTANFHLHPVGTSYDSNAFVDPATNGGNPCNSGNAVNSLTIAPLRMQVLAANGVTLVAAANAPAAGSSANLSGINLAAGDYYVRVYENATFSSPQMYDLTITNGAAGPANDNCARATMLASASINGSTAGATPDGSSSCAGNNSPDVWYHYTPTCSGVLRMDTCGSTFDTVLSLFTSCPGIGGAQVACNDDAAAGTCAVSTHSALQASVIAGNTYFIRVSGYNGASGVFTLNTSLAAPDNNLCAGAVAVTPGASWTGDNCASTSNGLSTCGSSGGRDVWFSYTPACSHTLRVDSEGSNFDTTLTVYTGQCNGLTQVACNDDFSGVASQVTLPVTAGVTYTIRLAGNNSAAIGAYTLNVAEITPPANDSCINAVQVTSGLYMGTTCGSSRDTSDSCRPTSTSGDVWYRWAAPCTGNLIVSTCGSLYDTVISVHQGACGLLTQIACNDDGGAALNCTPTQSTASYVSVPVTSGIVYFIRVSGYNGQSGGFLLKIDQQPNNSCDQATSAPTGNTPFSTVCASSGGAATCGNSAASPAVWFTHTAACNGPVWVDLCNSTYDTVATVYTGGCSGPGLTEIACNDDRSTLNPSCANSLHSFVPFRAQAGTTYRVRVSGYNGASGTGTLNIRCCPADFNLSGHVSVQDIYDFLSDWNSQIFGGAPLIGPADFNSSGAVTVQDIYDFLSAWNAGCN